jgi:hypothetical protein
LEDDNQTGGDERKNDGETTISPSPVGFVELLRDLGPRIRADDPGRSGKGKGETSVAKGRGVDSDDIYSKDDTDESDRVEALISADM